MVEQPVAFHLDEIVRIALQRRRRHDLGPLGRIVRPPVAQRRLDGVRLIDNMAMPLCP